MARLGQDTNAASSIPMREWRGRGRYGSCDSSNKYRGARGSLKPVERTKDLKGGTPFRLPAAKQESELCGSGIPFLSGYAGAEGEGGADVKG